MGHNECDLSTAIAHWDDASGKRQFLEAHLGGVEVLAREFGDACGSSEAAALAARWHDLGKASQAFCDKVERQPSTHVNHKSVGALWALQQGWNDVAFAIEGHHNGMPDSSTLKTLLVSQEKTQHDALLKRWQEEQPNVLKAGSPDHTRFRGRPYAFDLHVRMLFSCLVDADFLDTEAFLQPEKAALRKPEWPKLNELAARFFADQDKFIKEAEEMTNKDITLFELRCRMYHEVVSKAECPNGVFSMMIPTGGGKTRTALGFAFRHAQYNEQRRIVVALPYTSILDQMADEYKKIFGEGSFLEHHSAWQPPAGVSEDDQRVRRMELCAENWDAPLILTTTVQLFDSLFSNKPSDCRKLHNIARSVIVLDEVQTLPVNYLEPICDVLAELVKSYGVTILLSTATQPALDRVKSFVKPKPLIAEPKSAFTILKRVDYQVDLDAPWDWEKVADALIDSPRGGMVIVDLKRHAVELFQVLRTRDPDAFHLSTFLCGAHRKKVIEEVRTRLKEERPCRLVSTQVVEAGVDLDFPLVLRSVGPLDRVVQAAGRCNREGTMKERGKVVVFRPVDDRKPKGVYETGAGLFASLYKAEHFDPDDPSTFETYFSQLFVRRDLDANHIQDKRRHLNFEEVAKEFHLIEDGGLTAILVGYGGKNHQWDGSPAEGFVRDLFETKRDSRRSIFRQLQPYMVQVYADRLRQLLGHLILESEIEGLHYWFGHYDDKLGIAAEQLDIDSMIH